MPFPPPPAPAPRVSVPRPPPRRPRETAAPTCAPPVPLPPAATREKQRPPARPEALLSRSWPSATLRKPAARRAPGPASQRTLAPAGSRPSPARTTGTTASGPRRDAAARFPLSLPPEATPVLQRRHLEQQLLARPCRLLPVPLANATLPLGPRPRAKGTDPRRGGSLGGLDARPPGVPLPPRGRRAPDPGPWPAHLRRVLKVSLLNDQHKYDDVEYEEEAVVVDEGLVRRCTEWLRGVEAAAAARNRTRPLDALPHLSTL
ncbi:proline-rich protein 18 isoform 1-T2 [Glossophaga mutica]